MKTKLNLEQAKLICINAVDVIDNEAICIDSTICQYSKNMIKGRCFMCNKTNDLTIFQDEIKELNNILFGDKK